MTSIYSTDRSRLLTTAWTIACLGIGALRADGQAPSAVRAPIVVTTRMPVSLPGAGSYWWADINAAPDDPRRLIICGTFAAPARNAQWGFASYSDDGGMSWHQTLVDSTSTWVTEESCAMGPGGAAYFVTGASHVTAGELHHELGTMNVFRSTDWGRTWTLRQRGPFLDYTASVVDSASGRLFVFANEVANGGGPWLDRPKPFLLTSRDSGATFSDTAAAAALPNGRIHGAYPSGVALMPDGAPVAVFATSERVASARRGPRADLATGSSVAPPSVPGASGARDSVLLLGLRVVVAHDTGRTIEPIVLRRDTAPAAAWPSVAVDRSHGPHRGRIYAAWSESTGQGPRWRRGAVLVLARSDDGGHTWTKRRVTEAHVRVDTAGVPVGSRLGASIATTLAVNAAGAVGLAWTDVEGRCSAFTVSRDGGSTFAPSIPLSSCGPSARRLRHADNYLWAVPEHDSAGPSLTLRVDLMISGLDQLNMVADASGAFHPMWGEYTSTGVQLWTATVRVDSAPVDRELSTAGLADVSRDAAVTVERLGYDPVAHEVWAEASVVNRGMVPLQAPVRLELVRLDTTDAGPVEVANAGNGRGGAGAIWDLTGAIPTDGLAPEARSALTQLRFRLRRTPTTGVEDLLKAKFRVYARAP